MAESDSNRKFMALPTSIVFEMDRIAQEKFGRGAYGFTGLRETNDQLRRLKALLVFDTYLARPPTKK